MVFGTIGKGIGKLFSAAPFTTPILRNPRGIGIAASIAGYITGQEAVRWQGERLRAYYGEETYRDRYARGIDVASGLVTAGAGYTFASALLGGRIGKSPFIAPLGTHWLGAPGRGIAGAAAGAGRAARRTYSGIRRAEQAAVRAVAEPVPIMGLDDPFLREVLGGTIPPIPRANFWRGFKFLMGRTATAVKQFPGEFMRARRMRGKYMEAATGLRRLEREYPTSEDLIAAYRQRAPIEALAQKEVLGTTGWHAAKGLRRARGRYYSYRGHYARTTGTRGGKAYDWMVRSPTRLRSAVGRAARFRPGRPGDWRINPVNWSSAQLFRSGVGLLGASAVGGAVYGGKRYSYPIMEAGNVSLAEPVTNKLNFNTAGLTQALHDRRNRTL